MKIVVLLSGSLDSATCLALAIERVGNENISAPNIIYGQKHARELESTKAMPNSLRRKAAQALLIPRGCS